MNLGNISRFDCILLYQYFSNKNFYFIQILEVDVGQVSFPSISNFRAISNLVLSRQHDLLYPGLIMFSFRSAAKGNISTCLRPSQESIWRM
jgi:hypothetical protein